MFAMIAPPDGNAFELRDLLTAASLLVLATVYIVNARNAAKIIGAKFTMLETILKGVQDELKNMQQVIVTQAAQSERLNNHGAQIVQLQRDVADLRRGDGFIVPKNQRIGG